MRAFLKDLLKTVFGYLVYVIGGVTLFMVLCLIIGYLPYSDRPGPGWYGWFSTFDPYSLRLVLNFGLFTSPYALFVAVVLFLLTRLLEKFKSPKEVVSTIGASFSAFLTFFLVSGMGWYIAKGFFPVCVAALLGAIFGAWLLPKKTQMKGMPEDSVIIGAH